MKFTRIVDEFICEKIDAMNEAELQAVIDECNSLTKGNCSWIRYGLREIIREIATEQLKSLKQATA